MHSLYTSKYLIPRAFVFSCLFIILLGQTSCQKLVDIPPPINSITDEAAYSTDASAASVLTGLYVSMSRPGSGACWTGLNNIAVLTGLSGDELYLSAAGGPNESLFFRNSLISAISVGGKSWAPLYNFIYRCNAAIEGLSASKTLSQSIQQQLLGEAYFLRAFYYFHLVNLFGPVPLATATDYQQNTLLARASVTEIHKAIVDDLQQAVTMLGEQFLNGAVNGITTERVRPTKWAANALLARVYLYLEDYDNAIIEASKVMDHKSLFRLVPLNNVFLKNSQEAIWQVQPTTSFWNTEEAKLFIIPPKGFSSAANPIYLNPRLVNSAEANDLRFTYGNWIDTTIVGGIAYPYSFKYKDNTNNSSITPANGTKFMTEYLMMLRLGEVYLVRAEARAHQGDLPGAIADLDSIRQRAGLPLLSATNPGIGQEALLNAIFHERQVELFTEGCHRWFDLKRTGRIDAVMSVETPLKGGTWESREAVYPIPTSELQRAPNLEQTPGYPVTG